MAGLTALTVAGLCITVVGIPMALRQAARWSLSAQMVLLEGRTAPESLFASDRLVEGASEPMGCDQKTDNGCYWFAGRIPCIRSGKHQFAIRIVPRHSDLPHRYDTGMIHWGS